MLFYLPYRPLTLGNVEGHNDIAKFKKKKNFSLFTNRFLIKNFGHVISQDTECNKIGDTSVHF